MEPTTNAVFASVTKFSNEPLVLCFLSYNAMAIVVRRSITCLLSRGMSLTDQPLTREEPSFVTSYVSGHAFSPSLSAQNNTFRHRDRITTRSASIVEFAKPTRSPLLPCWCYSADQGFTTDFGSSYRIIFQRLRRLRWQYAD
jgi:hypothetical protein